MTLESLSLDSESIRTAIAGSLAPGTSESALRWILDFVENGDPPPYADESGKQRERWMKSLGWCKAALIKAIVTIAGDEKSIRDLWDAESAAKGGYPGGWFVEHMRRWVKAFSAPLPGTEIVRDDLTICGTLSLGNLARTG
jgi:hypothetical protein